MTYEYYINKDERGEFNADVRDPAGKTIWETEGYDIFEDGWISDKNDVRGLEKYLKDLRLIKAKDTIVRGNPVRKRKRRCWEGYKPVPGMKPYSKGSCVRANPVGWMTSDLKYLGTGLKLRKGQKVKVEVATNQPYSGYYVSPTDGSWGDASIFLRPGEITDFVTYRQKKEITPRELFKDASYYRKSRRNPTGSTWSVWEYDLWGNARDGWEVNNRMRVGRIELSKTEEENEFAFNKAMEKMRLKIRWRNIDQGISDEDAIYFVRERDGMPLGELTRD